MSYSSDGYIIHDGFLRRLKRSREAYRVLQKAIYSNPLKRKCGKYEFKDTDYFILDRLLHLIQWDLEYDIRASVQEISKHALPNPVGIKTAKFVKTKFVGVSVKKGRGEK